MDNKNREEYVNALDNTNEFQKKEELPTLSITYETLKKLKEIKELMEWNTDLALNAIFTFFFKMENSKNQDKIKLSSSKKQKEIKFSPTIKNEERINKYLEENSHSSIIELSIGIFYQKLIGSNSK